MKRVLITGGAGFIGAHLARELLHAGYHVRALDLLVPQVHGEGRRRPAYLDPDVELIVGDVGDAEVVRAAIEGMDAVVHLASLVGVGQSMYRIVEYLACNSLGTAVLLEELVRRPVERLVLASSMSVYGEGSFRDASGTVIDDAERSLAQLEAGQWELRGAAGEALMPIATTEQKPARLASVYALTKYDEERLCMIASRAYGFSATVLRLFNVYGEHQALANPYTGVLAIFATRILNRRPPMVFEDGRQRRDFVHVSDVARAFRLALEAPEADGRVFNIGSGTSSSVTEVASLLSEVLGRSAIHPVVTGTYRMGDIRHCFADISLARELLGYAPRVRLADGIAELGAWLAGQVPVDRIDEARVELEKRGLTL